MPLKGGARCPHRALVLKFANQPDGDIGLHLEPHESGLENLNHRHGGKTPKPLGFVFFRFIRVFRGQLSGAFVSARTQRRGSSRRVLLRREGMHET
jgi:hypothetical protein